MSCKAKTASGQPCKMPATKGGRFCFNHSPDHAAQRAQARKIGGQNRHTPHAGDPAQVVGQPRTIEAAYTVLDYALAETIAADNSIPRNRLLVAIAAGYVDAIKTGEIETQLKELLAVLASRKDT